MEGILVGCDANQEWLLPWWWEQYRSHNAYPVAFIDFGMTAQGLAFCRQRGLCLLFPAQIPFSEQAVPPKEKALWEAHYSAALWQRRRIWFKKPFALRLSPFPLSLWLDLDCQVQKPLDPLFNTLSFNTELALCREPESVQQQHREKNFIGPDETNYNCGVIAFRNDAPILHAWTQEIEQRNHRYPFDQQALARALKLCPANLFELPPLFNWSMAQGPNPHAYIQHYHGGLLKALIGRTHG